MSDDGYMAFQNITSIAMDKQLQDKISECAKHLRISRSALIRKACIEYIEQMKKKLG